MSRLSLLHWLVLGMYAVAAALCGVIFVAAFTGNVPGVGLLPKPAPHLLREEGHFRG